MTHFIRKSIFFFLFTQFAMASFAQKNNNSNMDNYKSEWEKIDKLENEGKTKTALETIESLLIRARNEKNTAQVVKSLFHKYKYQMIIEEESTSKIVADLKANIEKANGVEKALLQSILGEMLNQFYINNSYQFANRTNVDSIALADDFMTWDQKRFNDESRKLYAASLEQAILLQNTDISSISEILNYEGKNSGLRPTLYDFLAHRAIEFYSNGNDNDEIGTDEFEVNSPEYFNIGTNFSSFKIAAPRNFYGTYEALLVYQNLVDFRTKKNDIPAIIDLELERLAFVNEKSISPDKAELLLKSYSELANKYASNGAVAQVYFKIAQIINGKGVVTDVNGVETNNHKKALEMCETTIKKYPNTDGATNCEALKTSIQNPSLSIVNEDFLIPNKAFKAFLNYKNTTLIYCKIVAIGANENLGNKNTTKDIIKNINGKKIIKSWSQALPNLNDLRNHQTEIKIDGLPVGNYAIVMSTSPNFTDDKNAFAFKAIQVTNISFVVRNKNGASEYYVQNRQSGAPLVGAKVEIFSYNYNYKTRNNDKVKMMTLTTDKNGFASYENSNVQNYSSIFSIFKYGKETLDPNFYQYVYNNSYSEPQKSINSTLFTDRSIYRPGQTVYFKGIVFESLIEKHNVVPNFKTTVVLNDVNGQEVGRVEVETNEFGSYTGKFVLPTSGLTGAFTLAANPNGYANIQVEEYKRPKFEVLFPPVDKSYALNEMVTIKGKATAYSGANIDGAQVKYRVVRKTVYPIWCYGWYWRMMPQKNEERIIVVGTTKTDINGEFTVTFEAIPDATANKQYSPSFTYEISADVIDITGEMHSNTSTVRVGYLALDANISTPETIERDKENKFAITTNNLNGQFESAEIGLKLYELIEPVNFKKERLWSMPDQFTMTKAEHDKLFPNEVYKDENLPTNWEKAGLIKSANFNTKDTKEWVINANEIKKSGAYLLEFNTKDKNGLPITIKKIIYANALQDAKLSPQKALSVFTDKDSYGPNEKAIVYIGSSLKNAFVVVDISFKGESIKKEYLTINNEIQKISIDILEKYRGGLSVKCFTVNDNRPYQGNANIEVPFDSKDLKIEWSTFRDKLLPGEKDTWKLKIKGPKGEKVATELLAAMYDASLDAFLPHSWNFGIYQPNYTGYGSGFENGNTFGAQNFSLYNNNWIKNYGFVDQAYDELNYYGFSFGYGNYRYKNFYAPMPLMSANAVYDGAVSEESVKMFSPKMKGNKNERESDDELKKIPGGSGFLADQANIVPTKAIPLGQVKVRTNLNELAFFLPQLNTDAEGNISFSFQMPEALTKWKFMGLAHTKTMDYSIFEKEIITQKDLMVTPNVPRFLREGDKVIITTKITNLSTNDLNGLVELRLFDTETKQSANIALKNTNPQQSIFIPKGQSTVAKWTLDIPFTFKAIDYEIVASAGNYSDGEGATLPVLTNRMLVTESMPLPIRGKQTKSFVFKKLLESQKSTTLKNEKLTLEFTSQPAWYAVQALPYLMEFPHECAEQLFSRYYANTLGTYVANSSPKIKAVFEKWGDSKEALLSNLEKNQELKSLMIEETPWLLDAKNETANKKKVALFFDMVRMGKEQNDAMEKLMKLQTPNGGFTWFAGMPDSRYITQHIITGFGHLQQLKVEDYKDDRDISKKIKKAVLYLDDRMREDFENIKKYNKDYLKTDNISNDIVQYLYMRSFFTYIKRENRNDEAYNYFVAQAKKYALNKGMYMKGMLALALERLDDHTTAAKIMISLKENAVRNDEMGMYWKELEKGGYYWYQAPIETQALMIEAFDEVVKDEVMVDELKTWLLKQKQTQNWPTTKGTTEACYALLVTGDDWLAQSELVDVMINGTKLFPATMDATIEPGTGYYKVNWKAEEIKPEMAKIKVSKKDKGPAWGAMYWQYFEDLDKITPHETPLKLVKKQFKEEKTENGTRLIAIDAQHPILPGDIVKVRIELRVDRDMEYIHMKDMRSAGLEPINVLSGYKYQDGLGYYESTKDAATHFFFDYLPKGTYVFEYPLRANLSGDFSNGITHIECMYAPEFTSHSEGTRLIINEKP